MPRRVEGKAAIVVGGGQTKGETVGNGRATAIVPAREGARVLVADRHLEAARETTDMIIAEGGQAWPVEADITSEDDARRRRSSPRRRSSAASTSN
jgi:NAD(P)-dependent dehydrogenase (short-subunit alcohol dehydrogenase family)